MLKRKSPIKRKQPLARNQKPISRSGKRLVRPALRRSTKKIRNKGLPRFKRGRDKSYLAWIRGLPCHIKICLTTSDVHATHVKSRGAGGADFGNVIPLCARHHEQQHRHGIKSWAEFYFLGGLDELRRIAAEVYPAMYSKALALGWKPGGEF